MPKRIYKKIYTAIKPLMMRALMIENQIQHEQKNRWPDWVRLLRLKKLRLMIKDRIRRTLQNKNTIYPI